jgi:hypothetical protein
MKRGVFAGEQRDKRQVFHCPERPQHGNSLRSRFHVSSHIHSVSNRTSDLLAPFVSQDQATASWLSSCVFSSCKSRRDLNGLLELYVRALGDLAVCLKRILEIRRRDIVIIDQNGRSSVSRMHQVTKRQSSTTNAIKRPDGTPSGCRCRESLRQSSHQQGSLPRGPVIALRGWQVRPSEGHQKVRRSRCWVKWPSMRVANVMRQNCSIQTWH